MDGDHVREPDGHPELLPWLVSDRIDAEAAAAVRRHVDACAKCRREIEALGSLQETMRRHDRSDHVAIPDLVALEAGGTPASGATTGALHQHLADCGACAEEFAVLRRVREELRSGRPGGAETGRSARWRNLRTAAPALAAAAVIVLLALSLLLTRGLRPGRGSMASLDAATLSPALRGSIGGTTLPGRGPWALTILLPLGAPGDRYSVTIARPDGTPVRGFEIDAATARQGTLTVFVPRLPAPGEYVLRVRAADAPTSETIDYPFSTSR